MSDNNQTFNRGYSTGYKPQRPGMMARARKIFKETYPNIKSCLICGAEYSRLMQIHHLNGNYMDNDPINLVKLCKTCHHEIHYGIE